MKETSIRHEYEHLPVHELFVRRTSRLYGGLEGDKPQPCEFSDPDSGFTGHDYPDPVLIRELAGRLFSWIYDNYLFGSKLVVPQHVLGSINLETVVHVMDWLGLEPGEWEYDHETGLEITISWVGYIHPGKEFDPLKKI